MKAIQKKVVQFYIFATDAPRMYLKYMIVTTASFYRSVITDMATIMKMLKICIFLDLNL